MIVKEAIRGVVGKTIRDRLLTLIDELDKAALQSARTPSQPHTEVRYRVGVADGVRFALKDVMELGDDPE
jgi:hypothetical protein